MSSLYVIHVLNLSYFQQVFAHRTAIFTVSVIFGFYPRNPIASRLLYA